MAASWYPPPTPPTLATLQHVIAVLVPVTGDTLTTPPPTAPAYRTAGVNGIHIKIHLDLLIFVVGGHVDAA